MSWEDPDLPSDDAPQPEGDENARWDTGERWEEDEPRRWPLHFGALFPRERLMWFERLWNDVIMLRERYLLPVRSRWWEDHIQLEALAALAAWVGRYDSGEWDDPPGKLALLFDLERISALLRDGHDPFHPERDRQAFLSHLEAIGCQPSSESWGED
jgi:hypothetical protein